MKISLKDIIECTNGELIIGDLNCICNNICRDTRMLVKGDTYIGIKGENFDGNSLWEKAFECGAETVIVENVDFSDLNLEKFYKKNIVRVDSTILALANIAKYIRKQYLDLKLVGITGSVGKTSTKDMVSSVVSKKYKTLKTQGNKNNNIGLPFTIFGLDGHEAAVIEMGMNHLGEIDYLTKIAKPQIAVITNVGTSHIGNLGSRENILKAKLEILNGMDDKVLVLNNDNDLLHKFLTECGSDVKIYTFGIDNNSDVMAEDIKLNENNSEFVCNLRGQKFKVTVPVAGIHFVYNALCAVIVGDLLGIDLRQIVEGIETFELTKKRMDVVNIGKDIMLINDSYNASFESVQASLKYLGTLKGRRKIAVLGDMFELGEYAKELHEKVGEEVVKNNIDVLICCGNNSKYIVEKAKELMNDKKVYYFENKDEIVKFIKNESKEGDAILIKASNGMKFFEIAEKLVKEC